MKRPVSNNSDPVPSSSKGPIKRQQYIKSTTNPRDSDDSDVECSWRRQCGCLKTSEKLKKILQRFPAPPPPTPASPPRTPATFENTCISAYCTGMHQPNVIPNLEFDQLSEKQSEALIEQQKVSGRSWQLVTDLVQLVQISVTATALALYYLIYCYMQFIYYTLNSAIYFHNADGPMKITIGVVTVTSLVVGFNLLLRLERLVGIVF